MASDTTATPRLGLATKLSYGVGSVAQGGALAALGQGIIAYYLNQVIGLPPLTVGFLVLVSLVLDAVIDPVIGRWSDTFRSPWGRRHPFMYASAIPIGVAMYLFWNPPAALPAAALPAFVLLMLVALRLSISLYELPSTALTPELAPGYHERTDLLSFRWFFFIAGSAGLSALLLFVFVPRDAAHPLGMLNRAGYGRFGLAAAAVMVGSILVSSTATHRYIPYLRAPPQRRQSLSEMTREIVGALTNPSLMVLISSGLISGVASGVNMTLNTYISLHFWGLSPQVIGAMITLLTPVSILGVVLAPILSRALDKKLTMITVFILSIFTGVIPVSLRLVGLMPPNGSPWVPVILMLDLAVALTLALIGFVIITSMIADIVEDNAVRTGVRAEGLLFAANGLLPKVTGGLGGFIAGLMLTAVHFPRVQHGPVDPTIMRNLVLLSIPVGVVLNLISTSVLIFYRIDRSTHERNLEALASEPTMGAPMGVVAPGAVPIPEPRPASPV